MPVTVASDRLAALSANNSLDDLRDQAGRISRAYISALLVLLLVLVGSYFALAKNLQAQATHNELLQAASANQALLLSTFARSKDLREASLSSFSSSRLLRQIKNRLARDLHLLDQQQVKMQLLIGQLSDSESVRRIRSIFHEEPHRLHDQQQEYIERIRQLLAMNTHQLGASSQMWVPIDAASAGEGVLANGSRASMGEIYASLSSQSKKLRKFHSLLTAIFVGVLAIQALLIFKPLVQSLNRTLRRVVDAQESLDHIAFNDTVTNLPNRRGMARWYVENIRAEEDALMISISIENIASVHRLIGSRHEDEFMRSFSEKLKKTLPNTALMSKTGDEEFSVIYPGRDCYRANGQESELVKAANDLIVVRGIPIWPIISAGAAVSPVDGTEIDELIIKARVARSFEKLTPGNVSNYTKAINDAIERSDWIAKAIQSGLERSEFFPHYQLKYDTLTRKVCGMEALARWKRPAGEQLGPNDFIPVAEKTGLIVPLTWGLFEHIAADYVNWVAGGSQPGRVAVNVSEAVLLDDEFLPRLKKLIAAMSVDEVPLEIEITENIALSTNEQRIRNTIHAVRALGVTIALDDFGTGYASLSHLVDLEFDVLKIDRSFVSEMLSHEKKRQVINSLLVMCENLNKTSVAEGVEKETEVQLLKEMGCNLIQGFYFARPQGAAEIRNILCPAKQITSAA